MAEIPVETIGTWTAYPSLLSNLPKDEQRVALEDAACAHYCGRYQDAEAIFDSRLSDFRISPILVLQRADMLTSQGREHERIRQLNLALEDSAFNEVELNSVRLLLKFMLADAEFWALGQIKAVLDILPLVRTLVRSRGINNLSDVEIRCVTLYHNIVNDLGQCSNYIGKSDRTIFPDSKDSRAFELKSLRRILHQQERWRLATNVMQMELKHTASGRDLDDAIHDAFLLCACIEEFVSTLGALAKAPLAFRLVVLKKTLAELIFHSKHSLSLQTENEYLAGLRDITGASHTGWEEFFPVIAFDRKSTEILNSDIPYSEKVDQLRQHIQDAEHRYDFTKVNQTYISTRNNATEWLNTMISKPEESKTLAVLRAIGKAYFEFQEQQAKMAYYTGAALTDYLNILSVKYQDYSTVLKLVEDFEEKNPNFAIPNNQERLYAQAITGAKKLGMIEKQKVLAKRYEIWFLKCSFVGQGGGLSDEAISNPDFAFREIKSDSDDPVVWGSNAIQLMMRWAGYEWDRDLISTAECNRLFKLNLGDPSQINLAEYIKNVSISDVSESSFGTYVEPATTVEFMTQYRNLFDWILIPDRLPSRPARLFALKIFLQSRLYRVRQFLSKKGIPSIEEATSVEEETKALTEIEHLEVTENGTNSHGEDREKKSAINATLMKAFATNAVGAGLIDEAELVSRVADCRALITRQHNSGNYFEEYHSICQLIRLTWQRYLHFKTVPPEAVMPLVNEADALFIQTRNSIIALNPPENLVARARLSQDFSYREHHSYALAGRLQAFETYVDRGRMAQANNLPCQDFYDLAFQSYYPFLWWSFRSKGRGFIDILNLEVGVAQALEYIKENTEPNSDIKSDSSANGKTETGQSAPTGFGNRQTAVNPGSPEFISPSSENMVTKPQIDEMIRSLPDGVVIVDFLDLRYSPTTSFVAMIYRKGQLNTPTPLPNMSMGKIDEWVKENLDLAQEKKPGQLSGGNALRKLSELSGLLEPLVHTLPNLAIRPDETVILCPTGSLNRVPIHAIPIDGKPFIEHNPVVYCQSLTVLHWLWLKFQNRQQTHKASKAIVINPMPTVWRDGTPVQSNKRVAELARKLDADFHQGFDLQSKNIAKGIEGSNLIYYYGHVSYNPESAIDSTLILNEMAFKTSKRLIKPAGCEFLAARDFFRIKLREPALAVIVGCGSGITAISNTDDVLGIPTALFYAGASAVVSTLWSIDDEDGAEFSKQFCAALWEQKAHNAENASVEQAVMDTGEGIFNSAVDLAWAMQTAIKKLRADEDRKERVAPFHWAAFTLNGFWILPDYVLPDLQVKIPLSGERD